MTRLECRSCDATVEGEFTPCPVCRLEEAERELFDIFMWARGNLKEVQREIGVSYPTVRARIERTFERYDRYSESPQKPLDVLKRLRNGEIGVDEAEALLRRSRS